MPKIIFKGWRVGMRKIKFTFLLKNYAGLSLKQARDIKTKVLDNEAVEINISDLANAQYISYEADKLGVINELYTN